MNLMIYFFKINWLILIVKIYQEELLLIKYYIIKHLKLQTIQKNNGYQSRPASMVYHFFDKISDNGRIKHKVKLIYNKLMNDINH